MVSMFDLLDTFERYNLMVEGTELQNSFASKYGMAKIFISEILLIGFVGKSSLFVILLVNKEFFGIFHFLFDGSILNNTLL